MHRYLLLVGANLLVSSLLCAQNFAGDMALSKVLIPGEGWEELASGYGFTDGAATDEQGNFYFSGRKNNQGQILKITPTGTVSTFVAAAPGISGLQFGPDGKLYGTRWGKNDVVVISKDGSITPIATAQHPNDLVITGQGLFFFTSSRGVEFLDQDHQVRLVASGLANSNGISLSPKHGTLVVSEYDGKHVWAYRVEVDGTLSFGEPYMTMRLPVGETKARGDGATTDVAGRYYVCTQLGVQMFDATGRISGVISKPHRGGISNVEFSGDGLRYLYVTAGGSVYRRLTKTRGVLFFKEFRETL